MRETTHIYQHFRVEQCSISYTGKYVCRNAEKSFDHQCPLNHVCNNEGKCIHIMESQQVGKQCIATLDPYTKKQNFCPEGLFCVNGRCGVCSEGQNYRFISPTDLEYIKQTLLPNRKRMVRTPVSCVHNLFTSSKWEVALSNQDVEVTLITSCVIMLSVLLVGRNFISVLSNLISFYKSWKVGKIQHVNI